MNSSFIEIVLVVLLGLFMYKELDSLREENREIRKKFDELANITGNSHLAFEFIDEDLKKKLLELEKNDKSDEALLLLVENTRMPMEKARDYLSKLIEEEEQ